MSARRVVLLPLLLAAACTSGTKTLAARFNGPAALASFVGYTTKLPGQLHRYLAVASTRGNEIRIIDPEDGATVTSPGLVFPLSVPVFLPARLASTSLGDGLADLLVVVGQGSSTLWVVTTWDLETRVSPEGPVAGASPGDPLSLSVDLATDQELRQAGPVTILSLAAMPAPASALGPGDPPRVRVVLGLSNGQLAVVEYQRDGAGLARVHSGIVAAAPPNEEVLAKKALGVLPVDISFDPGGPRLFVATPDPLTDSTGATVHGVAQVDASASAAVPWPVVGLDARGPTRLVLAGRFGERTRASSRAYLPAPQLDVLAVLDESSCGPTTAIDCGLTILVPDQGTGGVPADPAGELSFRAPIQIPRAFLPIGSLRLLAFPLALTAVMPRQPPAPALAGDDPLTGWWEVVPDRATLPLLSLYRASGTAQAAGIAAVVAADGYVYLVDPGRWGLVDDTDSMQGIGRAKVLSAFHEPLVPGPTLPQFGLWNDVTVANLGGTPAVVIDTGAMISEIVATPGYLTTETWTIEWNGILPGLSQRVAALQRDDAGRILLSMQGQGPGGGIAAANRVWDGSLGVHRGDLVAVSCSPGGVVTTFTARVADFVLSDDVRTGLPAAPAFPGGALVLDGDGGGVCGEPTPPAGQVGALVGVVAEVRAQGLLLKGGSFGYAGRPEIDQPFEVRWQDEAPLVLAAQQDPNVALDAVRQAQEDLAVARKARRKYYPADAPCGALGTPTACDPALFLPVGADPIATGPVLQFRVGLLCPAAQPSCAASLDALRLAAAAEASELGVGLSSIDGLVPEVRRSLLAQATPTAVTAIDRSQYPTTSTLGTEIYASFLDDEVINFSPGVATVNTTH